MSGKVVADSEVKVVHNSKKFAIITSDMVIYRKNADNHSISIAKKQTIQRKTPTAIVNKQHWRQQRRTTSHFRQDQQHQILNRLRLSSFSSSKIVHYIQKHRIKQQYTIIRSKRLANFNIWNEATQCRSWPT